jgi:nucleotide-binding universal stress UspA family protein
MNYKHLLLPTDGSELSEKAIADGIGLAQDTGAKVTGFYACPEARIPHPEESDPRSYEISAAELQAEYERAARQYLAVIEARARDAGVDCTCFFRINNTPFEAIIRAAEEQNCDLIVMASHGRRGLAGILLGSETMKVLTHCKVPVLVCR